MPVSVEIKSGELWVAMRTSSANSGPQVDTIAQFVHWSQRPVTAQAHKETMNLPDTALKALGVPETRATSEADTTAITWRTVARQEEPPACSMTDDASAHTPNQQPPPTARASTQQRCYAALCMQFQKLVALEGVADKTQRVERALRRHSRNVALWPRVPCRTLEACLVKLE